MSNSMVIDGNLTADPELRTTQSGKQFASFSIASTKRKQNKQTGEWEDGDKLFMRCIAWDDLATNIAQSLSKGMRVIATGELSQRSYQAQDGSNRTVVEMKVKSIGPDLSRATAQVTKTQTVGGFQGYSSQQPAAPQQQGAWGNGRQQSAPSIPATPKDPWSQAQTASEFGYSDDGIDAF